MDIKVSLVLYHNPVDEVLKLVHTLLEVPLDLRVVVMDNSADDSFRYYLNDPRIDYIFCGENLGYGGGHNLAISLSKGKAKYHIVINPDIELEPETILDLFHFMEHNSNVGLVMPKILYRNGALQFLCKQVPTPADLMLRRFIPGPLKKLFSNQLAKYELRDRNYDVAMEVPNLSGCFMFLKTEVFEYVGLFDERFFMYMEDTDLSRRIRQRYRTVYYPRAVVIHGYAKASYKTLKLTMHHIKSSIKYFNKWGWFSDTERSVLNSTIKYVDSGNVFSTREAADIQYRTVTY
jgi:hypothetical protein